MEKMQAQDARITVRACDVGNQKDVEDLVAQVSSEMPSIKGVIHSAMVLHASERSASH